MVPETSHDLYVIHRNLTASQRSANRPNRLHQRKPDLLLRLEFRDVLKNSENMQNVSFHISFPV